MLANPIFIGEWDDALGLTAVALALAVECGVISRLLRGDVRVRGRPVFLALINALSWPCFFTVLPRAWSVVPPEEFALMLELPVVVFEAGALWAVGRTRFRPALVASQRLSLPRALAVVGLGNLASLLTGYVFLALILKPRGLLIVMALTGAILFALSEFVQILMSMSPARSRAAHRRSASRGPEP